MAALPVSVIVVSRHRPEALLRCITALRQQDHPQVELIVVADPAAARMAGDALQAEGLAAKVTAFDAANISAARNLGLLQAAGTVAAFIDDDAVAEPSWLSRLVAPFSDARVVAATGFVRGRNGISYQWRACEVDALAQDHPFEADAVTLHAGTAQRAVKTQGTNCAFRRDALLQIGGFDAALRFFLDEADVNLRLAPLGLTAVVPEAQVHHGYLASARRRPDRVPLDLSEIAASTAVFLRRHAPDCDLDAARVRLWQEQGDRVAAHRRAGRLTTPEAEALMQGLHLGWADGLARPVAALEPLAPTEQPQFLRLPGTGPRAGLVIAGRSWRRARLLAEARRAVAAGRIVTVFCLSPGFRRHQHIFCPEGYWLQTGGQFGQSVRSGAKLRLMPFSQRIRDEMNRIFRFRPVN